MKQRGHVEREFRVVAAGVFKATCLQLLDEVYENSNLTILVTKRGKLIGRLVGPEEGVRLSGPVVQVDGDVSAVAIDVKAELSDQGTKKDKKKKKHK